MEKDTVVIVGMARTPQGKLLGALKDITAPELGAVAIKAALERAELSPQQVQEVLMGCVLPAGLGQAPARQAALKAGLPISTSCSTVNKVCGSGMKTVMLARDTLLSGTNNIMVAGGMESMSNAPYLLLKARQGYRLGHQELIDHMLWDGLEDAYERGRSMGYYADLTARELGLTREVQDDYARISLERAQKAIHELSFKAEITPLTVKTKQGDIIVDTDEHPLSVNIEKIPQLPPAFMQDGTVTAANSSAIADGAAALVLMRLQEAEKKGLKPLARIIEQVSVAKAPNQFTLAPIDAIRKLLDKIPWDVDQVDLFEINEAFAVVPIAAMQALNIPHEKVNVHGSGCALGHPIGATGTRIIVTLISALQKYGLKRGVASLCIGGGEATAIAIEVL